MSDVNPPKLNKPSAIGALRRRIDDLDEIIRETEAERDSVAVGDAFARKCELFEHDLVRTFESIYGKNTPHYQLYLEKFPSLSNAYVRYIESGVERYLEDSSPYSEDFSPVWRTRKVSRKPLSLHFRDHAATVKAVLLHAIKNQDEIHEDNATERIDRTPNSDGYQRRVFIVHGHDGAAREAVAQFLERSNFDVVILHEKANQGRTVIEKFEANTDVGFAIVLLTADDVGGTAAPKELRPRARQNVILELGYFIGRLGRKRVVALRKGELEFPSDILGVVTEIMDEHGAWKQKLLQELQEAGYEIDWNKALR